MSVLTSVLNFGQFKCIFSRENIYCKFKTKKNSANSIEVFRFCSIVYIFIILSKNNTNKNVLKIYTLVKTLRLMQA